MAKLCKKCGKIKENFEFSIRTRKTKISLQPYCKECCKKEDAEYYQKNKKKHYFLVKERRKNIAEKIIEYKKKHKCEVCGISDYRVLDFHHKNPDEKDFDISNFYTKGYSFKRIMKEIEKCEILCANCHRIKHAS